MPVGKITITSTDPGMTIDALLGAERVNVEQGYGGWDEVARPRRRPLSVWVGSPALRMTVPIILDDFVAGRSVEHDITNLETLATPNAANGTPSRLTIKATGGFVPHQTTVWVIDDLAWGDGEINDKGNRIRQAVTLSLLEHISEVRVQVNSPANLKKAEKQQKTPKPGAPKKRVAAKAIPVHGSHGSPTRSADTFGQGEDLLTIAARELGDANRWVEIAQLNGIRDPRNIAPGQVLRLP